MISDFEYKIDSFGLSVRAHHVLKNNFHNINELLEADEFDLVKLKNCGKKTITEILKFQKMIATNEYNTFDQNFRIKVSNSKLSKRAKKIIVENFRDVNELISSDTNELFDIHNCGIKTIKEILDFQIIIKRIHNSDILNKNNNSNIQKKITQDFSIKIFKIVGKNSEFFEAILQLLSARARNIVIGRQINSIEQFLSISCSKMVRSKNCGIKTLKEINNLQERIYNSIRSTDKKLNSMEGNKNLAEKEIFVLFLNEFFKDKKSIDTENVYQYLKEWVLQCCDGSKKKANIYFLRMGMLGKPPATLESIGSELSLTRERVRQILNKIEKSAKTILNRHKLKPFIEKSYKIVVSYGGRVEVETLVHDLLVNGPEGHLLENSVRFISFLDKLPEWKNTGLKIVNKIVICANFQEEFIDRLSELILEISKQYAGEIYSENLWSIDYTILRQKLEDKVNYNFKDFRITKLSEAAINRALYLQKTVYKKHKNRLYSIDLWNYSCAPLSKAIEHFMQNVNKDYHFNDVYSFLAKFRNNDNYLTERNVHSKMGLINSLHLWGRGTFIHEKNFEIPYDLIKATESWIVDKLNTGVPFISVYGPFNQFNTECLKANIPNEIALYTVLKLSSCPLLVFPRTPYIYHQNGLAQKIPVSQIFEEFIQNEDNPVSNSKLQKYALKSLYLKEFQFNQALSNIPNVIKYNKSSFIHLDYLNITKKGIGEIFRYCKQLLNDKSHVSAKKIFNDKIVTCRTMGIESPFSLHSILKLYDEETFDTSVYPVIRLLGSDAFNKKAGATQEIVNFLKNMNRACSYKEIFKEFVEDLGYGENTAYNVKYRDEICSYLDDCLIHRECIDWNDSKQTALEEIVLNSYHDQLDRGVCFCLLTDILERDELPDIGSELYWTRQLLKDLLMDGGNFIVLGNGKNATVPLPNEFKIEKFEDLVFCILKNKYDGGENLSTFSKDLAKAKIVKKNITGLMLGKSGKVLIKNNVILLGELNANA